MAAGVEVSIISGFTSWSSSISVSCINNEAQFIFFKFLNTNKIYLFCLNCWHLNDKFYLLLKLSKTAEQFIQQRFLLQTSQMNVSFNSLLATAFYMYM